MNSEGLITVLFAKPHSQIGTGFNATLLAFIWYVYIP